MVGSIITNEFAEGPYPRWFNIAADSLREQSRPHGTVIGPLTVFGRNLKRRRAADDDGQQA